MTLPIVKGKYIGAVSDRASLQDKDKMEAYVQSKGWSTFEEMKAERKTVEADYEQLGKDKTDISDRMSYLKGLLAMYDKYEPYQKITPKAWRKKLDELGEKYRTVNRSHSDMIIDLARMEVLKHNKGDLERILENESHKRSREQVRDINPSL